MVGRNYRFMRKIMTLFNLQDQHNAFIYKHLYLVTYRHIGEDTT